MRTLYITLVLGWLGTLSTNAQSIIELGTSTYINRSDNFHHFSGVGSLNRYFVGINPYVKYSYTARNSLVYGINFSVYNIGTNFDRNSGYQSTVERLKPIEKIRERVYDFGFQLGYKISYGKLFVMPSLGIHIFYTDFFRAESMPFVVSGYDGSEGGSPGLIKYRIQTDIINQYVAGYSFGVAFEYPISSAFALTLGIDIRGSFKTLVSYDAIIEGAETREVPIDLSSSASVASLTNDNARYGLNLGIQYSF
jgi:hypothetical protein